MTTPPADIRMGDPCSCSARAGTARVHGRHANYPDQHWWLCSECGAPAATGWHNGEGWTFVVRRCGHRVHEATPMAGIRARGPCQDLPGRAGQLVAAAVSGRR